ncbi:MAG TPA: serine/threonine-protein kinase [Kofleriaceae bacterium]|nr:serine/threonine-protein kinase [Kofleriaceae bacterium]
MAGLVLEAGSQVGPYRVEEIVATGGFGTVFRARHEKLGRLAALKVLHADLAGSAESVERFRREAHAVNLIQHPNVVDIFDVGVLDDGRPYFVMEYLEGEDLEAHVGRHGPMPPAQIVDVFASLCAALTATHAKGIVHRDIKASNVFMASYGEQVRVVLLDYGVAKLLDGGQSDLTTARHIVGTPTCMAPEQIRGEAVDGRTDVYALGALAFHLLTGNVVFGGESPAMMQHLHLTAAPPRPSEVARLEHHFDGLIACAMAKRANDRYPDVAALLAALRRAAAATMPATPARPRPRGHRPVIAVYVGASSRGAPLDELAQAVVAGRDHLMRRGFEVAIDAGDAVVLVRPVDERGFEAAGRVALTDVLDTAELLTRADRLDKLELRVSIELCDAGFAGGRVFGEALRRLYVNAALRAPGTVHASPALLEGLDDVVAAAVVPVRALSAARVD